MNWQDKVKAMWLRLTGAETAALWLELEALRKEVEKIKNKAGVI